MLSSSLLFTGCIQQSYLSNNVNEIVDAVSSGYFNEGKRTSEAFAGTSAYANQKDFLLDNYDVKNTDAPDEAVLPSYDFSGPVNKGINDTTGVVDSPVSSDVITTPGAPVVYISIGHNAKKVKSFETVSKSAEKKVIQDLKKITFSGNNNKVITGDTDSKIQSQLSDALKNLFKCYTANETTSQEYKCAKRYLDKGWIVEASGKGNSANIDGSTFYEYKLCFDIAKGVYDELSTKGYIVQLSRSDSSVYDTSTILGKQRAAAANDIGANCILEIQADGYTGSTGYISYYNGKGESKRLAKEICNKYNAMGSRLAARKNNYGVGVGKTTAVAPILSWSSIATVYTVVGSIANTSDAAELSKPEMKSAISKALAEAIQSVYPVE